MESKKKKNNIFTIVIIVIMLAAALGVVIYVKGLPKLSLSNVNLDSGYEERKEKRDELQRQLLGEWQDPNNERFVIDTWRDGEGGFHAIINLSEAEDEVYFWQMDGSWQDNEDGFVYQNCKKSFVTYDASGNPSEEVIYEDGSGSIVLARDGIKWNDNKEKMGDRITFTYIGEY